MRPTCENCNAPLPHDAENAMICSFECTFCAACAHDVLRGICPNCGGQMMPRPIRPTRLLDRFPVSQAVVFRPVDLQAHLAHVAQWLTKHPAER